MELIKKMYKIPLESKERSIFISVSDVSESVSRSMYSIALFSALLVSKLVSSFVLTIFQEKTKT